MTRVTDLGIIDPMALTGGSVSEITEFLVSAVIQ